MATCSLNFNLSIYYIFFLYWPHGHWLHIIPVARPEWEKRDQNTEGKKENTQKRTTKIKTKCRIYIKKKGKDGKKTFTFLVASINKRTNCWCARYFHFLFHQSTLSHGKWPELAVVPLSSRLVLCTCLLLFFYLPYHHIKLPSWLRRRREKKRTH